MIKILFVCHGNICRSPMAEFIMKDKIRRLNQEFRKAEIKFEIASAATSTEEIGNTVYPPAKKILLKHGISCEGKFAQQIKSSDYDYYDFIVVMDESNFRNLQYVLNPIVYANEVKKRKNKAPLFLLKKDSKISLSPNTLPYRKISLLMEWANKNSNVADPWYTSDFETAWTDINEGCEAMLKKILEYKIKDV